jgi:hypothetical protein
LRLLATKENVLLDQVAGCLASSKQVVMVDSAIKPVIKKRLKI